MEKKKVVLAYSGGLDTSFCVKYFIEDQGFDVYTVCVNTGGFEEKELDQIGKKALQMGAKEHVVVDAIQDYYREGALMFMEFDARIRTLTDGAKSLDDFCASFFSAGDPSSHADTPLGAPPQLSASGRPRKRRSGKSS